MAKDDPKPVARISLPLSDDGLSVDWAHVRASTAEKFEGLLRTDPMIRKTYQEENGLAAGEDPDPFGGVTEENVHALLDTVGKANALLFQMVAGRWIKHPLLKDAKTGKPVPFVIDPDLLQHMAFNEKQHAELDPRVVKVAKKYEHKIPSWLREHMDLYMLGYMFIAYTAENAKTVLTAQVQRDLKRVQYDFAAKKAAGHGPQPDSDVPKVPVNGEDKHPPVEFSQPSPMPAPREPESEAPSV